MTISRETLNEAHRNARRIVKAGVPFGSDLEGFYTNNQNLQVLIFFELFRQTAYAMISDGGPALAIELMDRVSDEMRELKKASGARRFDTEAFRKAQNRKRKLEEWDFFMDIPYAGEVPEEDDEDYVDF